MVEAKYVCIWCDGASTYHKPFCPKCERRLTVEALHRRSQKVGQVTVNFTVGRITSDKG